MPPPIRCKQGSTLNTGFCLHIRCKPVQKGLYFSSKHIQNQNMGCQLWNRSDLEENIHMHIFPFRRNFIEAFLTAPSVKSVCDLHCICVFVAMHCQFASDLKFSRLAVHYTDNTVTFQQKTKKRGA